MQQAKRYRNSLNNNQETGKDHQLSSLFSIISNNLILAAEVLSTEYKISAVNQLESLCRKAKFLSKELMSESRKMSKEEIQERITSLKHSMLALIVDLTQELSHLDTDKNNSKLVEDIVVARRLLRESQRGLLTL